MVQVRKGDKLRLYNKGAAEWVLQRCVAMANERGDVVAMTGPDREELMQVGAGWGQGRGAEAFRMVACFGGWVCVRGRVH